MTGKRYEPDDPREWLNRARSSLERAAVRTPNSYLEDLCFDAQQAAEKAMKAILLVLKVKFPYVHDLDKLLDLIRKAGMEVPQEAEESGSLSVYAFSARYPGVAKAVTDEQHQQALSIAESVVKWAEAAVQKSFADRKRSPA